MECDLFFKLIFKRSSKWLNLSQGIDLILLRNRIIYTFKYEDIFSFSSFVKYVTHILKSGTIEKFSSRIDSKLLKRARFQSFY